MPTPRREVPADFLSHKGVLGGLRPARHFWGFFTQRRLSLRL